MMATRAVVKKPVVKKPVVKKPVVKKPFAKKAPVKKPVAKKAPVKKVAVSAKAKSASRPRRPPASRGYPSFAEAASKITINIKGGPNRPPPKLFTVPDFSDPK